jgi:2-polyprenyl-3-methyl-5-hydroxy-6-metoxy-1,4-benzoquinol methylase
MDKKKIYDLINKIQINLNDVLREINSESEPVATHVNTAALEVKDALSDKHFEELKILLASDEWPEAVLDFQIVNQDSEEEKMDRAEGIVDILVQEEIQDKKFLDFGCGEGHMVKYASKDSAIAVGYDIAKPEKSKFNWEEKEDKFLLTTDFEKVKEEGPYDVIMIYDVIDHAEGDPVDILIKAKSVLSIGGKIYMRTHPWSSRHGGHLYRKINKAFVHLVFTQEELELMGYTFEEKHTKVIFPIATYAGYIEKAKLKKKGEPDIEHQTPEDFFKNSNVVSSRLKKLTPNGKDFPEFQMSQCFHDYVLVK